MNCVAGALAAIATPGITAHPVQFGEGSPCWLQPSGIETLLRNTELREIGLLPQQPQLGATTLNSTFTPPPPFPNAVGLSSFSGATAGLPKGSNQATTGLVLPVTAELIYGAAPTDPEDFNVGRGPAAKIIEEAQGSDPVVCRSQLPRQMQAGGAFWNSQIASAASAQLPSDASAANLLANAASFGNPALAPTGGPSVLSPIDPTGVWCRPPPVLFANTSPLANPVFWVPFEIALVAVVVLWVSRGARMPRL